jgi:lipid-binding SYLF domain-containing protein
MNRLSLSLSVGALAFAMCSAAAAADVQKERAEIRKMCDAALATLYKAKPELKSRIAKSPGYGCFSSFGLTFIVGGAGGRGLVHDNAAKKDTYMSMGQATAGIEAGIKDYREVLVFKDRKTLKKFVDSGWEFAGGAGATAKVEGKGGAAEAGAAGQESIEIYPITKTGLALGASAGARKYWKSKELN